MSKTLTSTATSLAIQFLTSTATKLSTPYALSGLPASTSSSGIIISFARRCTRAEVMRSTASPSALPHRTSSSRNAGGAAGPGPGRLLPEAREALVLDPVPGVVVLVVRQAAHDLGRVGAGALEGGGHEAVEVTLVHDLEAHGLDVVDVLVMLGDEADAEEVADVDRHGAQTEGATVGGEVVLEDVAAAVVALAAVAHDAREGAEHDEEVELLGEELVQVPGAVDLGTDGGPDVVRGHGVKQGVLSKNTWLAKSTTYPENHGASDASLDLGNVLGLEVVQDLTERRLVSDVAVVRVRGGTESLLQLGSEGLVLLAAGSRAGQQDEMPGALLGQPAANLLADAADAGNDIGGVGVDVDARDPGHGGDHVGVVDAHDDLAHVLAGLHVPEGLLDLGHGEELEGRDGFDGPVVDEPGRVLPEGDGAGRRVVLKVEQVDADVGLVVEEGLHVQARVGEEVGLADLEEPAELGQAVPRHAEELAGEGVEHDVDAAAVGGPHDGLGEAGVSAAEDVVLGDAVLVHDELLLLVRADRGEDLGPLALRDHDGGLADTSGGGVDQDLLAPDEVPGRDQGVLRRQEDEGHGGRLLKGHGLGDGDGALGGEADVGGEGVARGGHDAVAGLEVGHGRSDARDDAGGIDAQLVLGEVAQGDEDVLEVEADGLDLDLDPVLGQGLVVDLVLLPPERVEEAGRLDGELEGPAAALEGDELRLALGLVLAEGGVHAERPLHAGDVDDGAAGGVLPVEPIAAAVAQGHLENVLGSVVKVDGAGRLQVEGGEADSGVLVADGSRETNHQGLHRLRAFHGGTARDPESAGGAEDDMAKPLPVGIREVGEHRVLPLRKAEAVFAFHLAVGGIVEVVPLKDGDVLRCRDKLLLDGEGELLGGFGSRADDDELRRARGLCLRLGREDQGDGLSRNLPVTADVDINTREASLDQRGVPLVDVQQGAALAAVVFTEPPTGQRTHDEAGEDALDGDLGKHEAAAGLEQRPAVGQGLLDALGGVEDVGAHDEVVALGLEALLGRLVLDVERRELHDGRVLGEAVGGLGEEAGRDVGEAVLGRLGAAVGVAQALEDVVRGAAGAGADLEDLDAGALVGDHADVLGHVGVEARAEGAAVERVQQVALRHDLQRLDLAREDPPEVLADAVDHLDRDVAALGQHDPLARGVQLGLDLGLAAGEGGELLDGVAHPLDVQLPEAVLGHERPALVAPEPGEAPVDVDEADVLELVEDGLVVLALERAPVHQLLDLRRLEQVGVLVPGLAEAGGPGLLGLLGVAFADGGQGDALHDDHGLREVLRDGDGGLPRGVAGLLGRGASVEPGARHAREPGRDEDAVEGEGDDGLAERLVLAADGREQEVEHRVQRGRVDDVGVLEALGHDRLGVRHADDAVARVRPGEQLRHVAEGRAVLHPDGLDGVVEEAARGLLADLPGVGERLRVPLVLEGQLALHRGGEGRLEGDGHEAPGVDGPLPDLLGPRRDGELVQGGGRRGLGPGPAGVELDHDLDALLRVGHSQRGVDGHVAELVSVDLLRVVLLGKLASRLDGHDDDAGSGVQDVALDLVLPDPGALGAPEVAAPRRVRRARHAVAEQVRPGLLSEPVLAAEVGLVPELARVVPRVRRQVDQHAGAVRDLVDAVDVDLAPLGPELAHGLQRGLHAVELAPERRGVREVREPVLGGEGVEEVAPESRVRAQLDKDAGEGRSVVGPGLALGVVQQRADGTDKVDRGNEVVDPVRGRHLLGGDQLAGHGGEHGNVRGAVCDALQSRFVPLSRGLHVERVIRNVHGQTRARNLRLGQDLLELLDGHVVAGDGAGLGAVEATHDGLAELERPEVLTDALGARGHGQHAAVPGDGLGDLASQPGDLDRGLVVDEAGAVGGRDLTARVAHDGHRLDAPRLHEVDEGDLQGGAGGLAVVGPAQVAVRLAALQLLGQGPRAAQGLEDELGAQHAVPEGLAESPLPMRKYWAPWPVKTKATLGTDELEDRTTAGISSRPWRRPAGLEAMANDFQGSVVLLEKSVYARSVRNEDLHDDDDDDDVLLSSLSTLRLTPSWSLDDSTMSLEAGGSSVPTLLLLLLVVVSASEPFSLAALERAVGSLGLEVVKWRPGRPWRKRYDAASSMMTWALAPPKPNELMLARRGPP
ncbi:hypothetical protein ColKHC_10368 [Colletotrichum higginsianum]|nr:hypothetical protein ColKHC_10368 [Colletotrichum higginsianum]